MLDTPSNIQKKQLEIIQQKTPEERFRIADNFIVFGLDMLKNSIINEHPHLSDIELKIEIFKRCYAHEFSEIVLEAIISSLKKAYQKQGNSTQ